MKKIEIAEPCQENWDDFTPTQRGAFCGKCQINVIDFSQKSNSEIQLILVENSGKKMCGRFTNKQLDSLNSDFYLWQNQSSQTFNSKFVLALIMVFGLTLFSCANNNDEEIIGKFQIENVLQIDTLKLNEPVDSISDSLKIKDEKCMVKGKIAPQEPEIIHTLGEIEYVEEIIMGDIAMPEPEIMVAGGIGLNPDFIQNLNDSIPKKEQTETPDLIKLTDKFEVNVFPNPTANFSQLKINVLANEYYIINLIDFNGKLIRNELNDYLTVGEHHMRIDLNQLAKGVYFLQISTDTQSESIRLIKS